MTDLEDLWESYPTSEPPTPELLREGRRQARARRRHLVLRPLLVGVTTAALAGAFLVGTHAGTDAGGDATAHGPGPAHQRVPRRPPPRDILRRPAVQLPRSRPSGGHGVRLGLRLARRFVRR